MKIRNMFVRRYVGAVLLVTTMASAVWAAAADPRVAPPESKPLGQSYAEWGAAWWQWIFSLPATTPVHPLLATGAVDCSYGQQGQVWFLAGTLAPGSTVRSCVIPTGTRLFFPVFNAWADNVAEPDPFTVEELMERAASFAAAKELHVTIDGVPVKDPFAYRAAYAPFTYSVPSTDNLLQWFGADVPGIDWPSTVISPAASDGYWLMLQPLSPGIHTINFGGTSEDGTFAIDISYTINVVPKGQF